MSEGTIRWWNPDRGWGFAAVEGVADVFVHHAGLEDDGDLRIGECIRFKIVPGYFGSVARDIVRKAAA